MQRIPRTLKLNASDNVIVAVDTVDADVTAQGVTAVARIPRGHKMAAQRVEQGQPIVKFGQIIGFATETIAPGAHVHTHNCSFAEFERDYAFAQAAREETLIPPADRCTFEGYRRANGKVGTRNYIGVLTSVNCSASVARFMAEAVGEKLVDIIRWWQAYCARNDGSMDNNPSPGNKAGGITTILGKVAGRGCQGRHHSPERGLSLCRTGDGQRLRLHGYARLRPRRGHGAGGRRMQRSLLHHGAWLGLRLQAHALHHP